MTDATYQRAPHAFPNVSTSLVSIAAASEWDDTVARLGGDDVYLRRGYHQVSKHLEPDGAQLVLLRFALSEAELALPLLVRRASPTLFDATSAYGYGGPVARGDVDRTELADAFDEWARENLVVATFLRFHPLLDNARLAPANAHVIELGATVAWDVSSDRGELLPLMHTHHRRAVRKAEREGVEVRISVNPAALGEFRELYDVTMRRQEAAKFYFFPDAYWHDLAAYRPGGDLVLIEALLEEEPIAALLCFARGPWLHYHLGASADAARNIGASNACFFAAAEWAQSRGMTRFHLGGGVGAGTDSALFQFKHRYDPGSEPHPFHIAKLVHDSERYRELAGTDSTDGYFPPWRSLA